MYSPNQQQNYIANAQSMNAHLCWTSNSV